jgi:pimeloyl-ACP methyl ester carboxylesterase
MGAAIAETTAFRHPGLVRSLVLMDGSIPGGPPNPGPLALGKLLFSRKWYRAYRKDPAGAFASLERYYARLDALPGEDRAFLRERVMARVNSASQERAFFATQRSLVFAHLSASAAFARLVKRYPGKILLLWGAGDRIVPLSSAKAFQTLRPDIELGIIPGAGHLPHQEKPGETARRIADFANHEGEAAPGRPHFIVDKPSEFVYNSTLNGDE